MSCPVLYNTLCVLNIYTSFRELYGLTKFSGGCFSKIERVADDGLCLPLCPTDNSPAARLFSAKGAAFIGSLGQRPRDSCNAKPLALKARFIPVPICVGLTANR